MFRQIRTIAFYTFIEALRNRLIWLIVAVALIAIGLSGFLNELAITESRQIQIALIAAFSRFAAVFLIATFVVTSMVRESNDKGLELILALPLPRAGYLLGKLLGFGALALVPTLLFGLLAWIFSPLVQVALWTVSLLCELWIVAGFSLLCVLTFKQIMTALSATMAFYIGARSITAFQMIGQGSVNEQSTSQSVIGMVFGVVGAVLPRLDEFTRTEWLVYHSGALASLPPILLQSAIFMTLIAGAALFDLYRKNI